jgi:hypothetical protein
MELDIILFVILIFNPNQNLLLVLPIVGVVKVMKIKHYVFKNQLWMSLVFVFCKMVKICHFKKIDQDIFLSYETKC